MKFVVYSRAAVQVAPLPEVPWALISICEKGDFPVVAENDTFKGRLNMQFHDVDVYAYEKEGEPIVLFDEAHAKQIWDFYCQMKEAGVEVFYVHCLMGQCRSAAVAAALSKVVHDDDERFFNGKGPYRPNMRVFRCIMEEAFARGLF